ncbi:MAG: hypothetical protein MJZ27_00565 [Bacteroidales bacterium]|nr:hypothetical protein [Bacteroidales bacterium]
MPQSIVAEIKNDFQLQIDLLRWADEGSIIFIRTRPEAHLVSKISAIIEDEGLQILSIGSRITDEGYTEIYIKISTQDVFYAITELQRHGYNTWTDNQEATKRLEDMTRRSYDQLMSYLAN